MAASDLASHNLETSLGPYPICTNSPWTPLWDQEVRKKWKNLYLTSLISGRMVENPFLILMSKLLELGFRASSSLIYDNLRWRHAHDLDGNFEGCSHILAGVTGPLQTVILVLTILMASPS